LSNTIKKSDWKNAVFLTNVEEIEKLKNSEGSDLKVWGSSKLVQLLLKHDLVDEFWLNIHPVLLGKGKKLFDDSAIPAAFSLIESTVTPSGLIMANYRRAGKVKTGTAGA
jgi:dihydrofolate reductase